MQQTPGPGKPENSPGTGAPPKAASSAVVKTPTKKAGTAAQRRKKQAKKRRRNSIVVFCVLLAVLVGIGLLVGRTRGQGAAPFSQVSSLPLPVSSVPVSVSVAISSVAPVSSSAPPAPPSPYNLDTAPPLFNYENFIPQEYTQALQTSLTDVGGGQRMQAQAAAAFTAMYSAAAQDGVNLAQVSGYRTNQQQTNNYNASIQRYINQGYSKEQALQLTQDYYAIPGTSEHEAGLAMDVGWIDDSFANSEEFTWLQEHAAEYGFIMRYASNTYDITHIRYEPWHYRFVGANHAARIVQLGITLEEYIQLLNQESGSTAMLSPPGSK